MFFKGRFIDSHNGSEKYARYIMNKLNDFGFEGNVELTDTLFIGPWTNLHKYSCKIGTNELDRILLEYSKCKHLYIYNGRHLPLITDEHIIIYIRSDDNLQLLLMYDFDGELITVTKNDP